MFCYVLFRTLFSSNRAKLITEKALDSEKIGNAAAMLEHPWMVFLDE